MALTRSTARRYAEAAFQIAERDDSLADWQAALAVAEDRLSDPDAVRLLASPAIAVEHRLTVLDRILGEDVTGPPRNLLALLVRRGRFDTLPAVIREFRRLVAQREGIAEAIVTSAVELDDTEQAALRQRLEQMTGSRVEMRLEVDPSLLGGVQVRLGDQLIDGSVRNRLEQMRARFSTTAI